VALMLRRSGLDVLKGLLVLLPPPLFGDTPTLEPEERR
jgi:hypothetical protein